MSSPLKISVSRLILLHVCGFLIFLVGVLGITYWIDSHYLLSSSKRILENKRDALIETYNQKGERGLQEMVTLESQKPEVEGCLYFLLRNDRGLKTAGLLTHWPEESFTQEPRLFETTKEFVEPTLDGDFNFWPIIDGKLAHWPALVISFPNGSELLMTQHYEFGEELRETILPSVIATLLFALAGSLLLSVSISRNLTQKVEFINRAVTRYREGELEERIDMENASKEFASLGTHLNFLFESTQRLLVGMRRLTVDVAHDLRTPLTRVKTRMEVTLLSERSPQEYRDVIEESLDDLSKLVETFNALLQLGQLESQNEPLEIADVDFGSVISDLLTLYDQDRIAVSVSDGCWVQGNKDQLQRLVSNLLENALKFSPDSEAVSLSLKQIDNFIRLEIADRGPGIPPEKHQLVLERFYRSESARSTPGNGLGLSLVKAVVDLHGGKLQFEDNSPGLKVWVDLPNPSR